MDSIDKRGPGRSRGVGELLSLSTRLIFPLIFILLLQVLHQNSKCVFFWLHFRKKFLPRPSCELLKTRRRMSVDRLVVVGVCVPIDHLTFDLVFGRSFIEQERPQEEDDRDDFHTDRQDQHRAAELLVLVEPTCVVHLVVARRLLQEAGVVDYLTDYYRSRYRPCRMGEDEIHNCQA